MASNNFRARKLVHMVVNTDVCHDNSVRNTELSTSTLTIEIEPEDTKKSEDEIFTDRQDIASSQDVVNADFSLNLSSAALGDIRVSDYSFSKDESFGLLCNETLTHSLMGSPVADFGTEDEPTTSQGLQEIENQRSNESCPDVDNAPTTSNNQILVTDSVMQNEDNEAANRLVCDALKGTTKKGTPRIRKLYTESTNTRKEAKKQKKIEKFCVKPACTTSCKKKCGEKFSESDRMNINQQFWGLNYESQGYYIQSLIKKQLVNRRLQISTLSRNNTFKYFLEKANEKFEVCKIFFLTTLGYNKKNDRRILDAIKKPWNAQTDKRGKREHKEKIDRNQLKEHIESFRPAIAHYRRKHAPNKRYLPSDLNATLMFKDFQDKFPDIKVSYELYRHFLKKDMNISFTLLGNEECEDCESFKLHQPTCQDSASCDTCISYKLHKQKYEKARKCYQEDVDLSTKFTEKAFYSADLQKVIMLPRIDMFKAAIFCPRIIAFNESFVPLGPTKSTSQPFAAIWHEAISGRKQEDIISAFRAFFICKRDSTDIVVWADNCSSQNKNWAFFSFLIQIINSSLICANTITIKYLESGHTFMSADNFHHQVEQQLKRAKKVYDFSDFIDCIQLANSGKVTVKPMEVTDFYKYIDHSSQHKLKKSTNRIYLKDIVSVEVRRNNFNLFVKTEHDGELREIGFLKMKHIKSHSIPDPIQNSSPRGITEARKSAIISTLTRVIPENRLPFWQNLHTNDNSIDLVNILDVDDCDE
ncbi:unnamed protein product [Spodoptera exigua]|nr:unnamed protein product [Spodoptera exigua]